MYLLLLILFIICGGGTCNQADFAVYAKHGAEFPFRFRQYGGLFVDRDEYIEAIRVNEGLTKECATCYGDAYICGWNNCKLSCVLQDEVCDTCLINHQCKQDCDKCTGFIKHS